MTKKIPTVSVIIPTHNRCGSLRRTLIALSDQTYPLEEIEVIVVADCCTDQTVEMVQNYQPLYMLRITEISSRSAAVSRNYGAALASANLLIFLDDDVEPVSTLIEAHIRAHQDRSCLVVIGPYPPVLPGRLDFFQMELRSWWESKFYAMRNSGHRFTYRDLVSGNFSLEAELFASVGGFDPAFKGCGGEDYELGIRLIKAGADLISVSDALAYHYEASDLNRGFQRARQEGRADVLIGQRHPELRQALKLAQIDTPGSRLNRLLCRLAFSWPSAGEMLVAWIRPLLDVLERLRLRGRWRSLAGALRNYWYWRGVVDELGSQQALADFVQFNSAPVDNDDLEFELDLSEGLATAERLLDQTRPASARIRYGQQIIGYIGPQPGAELLRGAHLRPILATDFAWPLLMALTLETTITKSITDGTRQLPFELSFQSTGVINANQNS